MKTQIRFQGVKEDDLRALLLAHKHAVEQVDDGLGPMEDAFHVSHHVGPNNISSGTTGMVVAIEGPEGFSVKTANISPKAALAMLTEFEENQS